MRARSIVGVAVLLVVAMSPPASAWRTERAALGGGDRPALAVSPDGRPIVGLDSGVTVEVAERFGRGWRDAIVVNHGLVACDDIDLGRAIAVAPSGVVTLAGACDAEANNPDVQVSTRVDGRWSTTEPVAVPTGDFCIDTVWFDMVLHPGTHQPWVGYSDSFFKSLTLAREVRGLWREIEVPAPSVAGCLEGPVFEMAFAPDQTLGLAVTTRYGPGPLTVLERAKGSPTWVESPIADDAVGPPDITYGSDGTALVVFRQPDPAGGQRLSIAWRPPGGEWRVDVVDDTSEKTGFDPGIAQRGGVAVIVYRDQSSRSLMAAIGDPSSWTFSTVTATGNPRRPAIAIDAGGRINVAYEAGTHDVWWARGP